MAHRPLPTRFQPRLVMVDLPCSKSDIDEAEFELHTKSRHDTNHCYGYFPGMKAATVDADLPSSRHVASVIPQLEVEGKKLGFNFIRMSLVQQHGDAPFHLDSDAATALTGDTDTLAERLVWRLLLNMSDEHARTLAYVDADSSTVELSGRGGYIHCKDANMTSKYQKSIAIPPRRGLHAQGVLFCASRVLHTGRDDEHGHFVMGYGSEEADA